MSPLAPRLSLSLLLLTACAAPAPAPPPPPPPPPAYAVKVHPPLVEAPAAPPEVCAPAALARREQRLPSAPGVEAFVVSIAAPGTRRGAVVLTHGAGSPASALWDLPGSYSMMRKLACAGFDTYAVDVRGFGGASMPPPGPDGRRPPVRAADVMPEVAAAVALAQRTSGVARVDLVGWSWGCVVSGMFAGLHPEAIRRLVLFAPVYDRVWPTRHATENTWSPIERGLFMKYFDPAKEERGILEAHVEALFRFAGPDGAVLLSNGPYHDLYGPEGPVWDPGKVKAPTLVVRGELDKASLEPHAYRLFERLTQAALRRYVVLGGADHFAFRTYRAPELQAVLTDFLSADLTP